MKTIMLNTNTRPTYTDVQIMARLYSRMVNTPAYVFETAPGLFSVYAEPDLATAKARAQADGHASPTLVETVRSMLPTHIIDL